MKPKTCQTKRLFYGCSLEKPNFEFRELIINNFIHEYKQKTYACLDLDLINNLIDLKITLSWEIINLLTHKNLLEFYLVLNFLFSKYLDVSIRDLEDLNISRKTCYRYLKILIQKGLIEYSDNKINPTKSFYLLNNQKYYKLDTLEKWFYFLLAPNIKFLKALNLFWWKAKSSLILKQNECWISANLLQLNQREMQIFKNLLEKIFLIGAFEKVWETSKILLDNGEIEMKRILKIESLKDFRAMQIKK